MKMRPGVDVLLHQPFIHPILFCLVGLKLNSSVKGDLGGGVSCD